MILAKKKLEWHDADYWVKTEWPEETTSDMPDESEAHEWTGIVSHLLLGDSHGVYIPQKFATMFNDVFKISSENLEAILNPDCEWYWDAWHDVTTNSTYKDDYGNVWRLEQDGDLFILCDVEWEK